MRQLVETYGPHDAVRRETLAGNGEVRCPQSPLRNSPRILRLSRDVFLIFKFQRGEQQEVELWTQASTSNEWYGK